MKKNLSIVAFLILANSFTCLADTFVLKDGSSINAKITSETAENYVLEVSVTKNIKDERILPKASVFKIIAEKMDETAFEKIEKLIPTPDLLSKDQYQKRIAEAEKFIAEYKSSTRAINAKRVLETLKVEAEQISKGGIKYQGKIITAAEYEANAYELDAEMLANKIQADLTAGQILPALRAFTKLDAEYIGTNAWRGILPMIKQAMQTQGAQAQQLSNTFEKRSEERQMNLQQMSAENRRVTGGAIAEEQAEFEMNYKKEKEAGVKWPTMSPFVRDSLDETVRTANSEMARISEPLSFTGDSGKVYRETLALLKAGDRSVIDDARKAVSDALISERYVLKLREQMNKMPNPENQ
jgi:hypothetical protein